MKRIGIIAGYGRLPVIFAREAVKGGYQVFAVGVVPHVNSELAHYAQVRVLPLGDWQGVLDALHAWNIDDIYLLGKVSKECLYTDGPFDDRFRQIVAALPEKNDNALLLAFVTDLNSEGFVVREQTDLLPSLIPAAGVLSARWPQEQEWQDIALGFRIAKGVAGLDVGQTCVVKDGAVLAVEAIDGTDACIRRGGRLCKEGAVAMKVAKPHQDWRFDVPVIGLTTLEAAIDGKAAVLAFEANATFVMDKEQLVTRADAAGISLVSFQPTMAADHNGGYK